MGSGIWFSLYSWGYSVRDSLLNLDGISKERFKYEFIKSGHRLG